MTRIWSAIVMAALVISVGACGADDPPSANAGPEAASASRTACDLLTEDEATALVGKPVSRAELPAETAPGDNMCVYVPPGTNILADEPTLYLGVMLERNTYKAPADIRNGMTVSEDPDPDEFAVSEVPDLGEYAVYFPSEEQPSVTVYVKPGLAFRIWGSGGEVTEQRLIEGARLVADELARFPSSDAGIPLSCHGDDSAGNAASHFFGDVQQGRDPAIRGGVEDPFGCAYELLCTDIRERVSETDFRSTRAEAVSEALSADTWEGPSVYDDRHLAEAPDIDKPQDDTTWTEARLTWYDRMNEREIRGVARTEKWRVGLLREGNAWKVCELTMLEREAVVELPRP